jgi:hypothetical protein
VILGIEDYHTWAPIWENETDAAGGNLQVNNQRDGICNNIVLI